MAVWSQLLQFPAPSSIHRKCVSVRALEQNNILQATYMNHIADTITNPDTFMFVSEAACNHQAIARVRPP